MGNTQKSCEEKLPRRKNVKCNQSENVKGVKWHRMTHENSDRKRKRHHKIAPNGRSKISLQREKRGNTTNNENTNNDGNADDEKETKTTTSTTQ